MRPPAASSRRAEKSYENPQLRKSIWRVLVFDSGLRQGKAEYDGDKRVSVQEALRFAALSARRMTTHQRPDGRLNPVITGDMRSLILAAPRV